MPRLPETDPEQSAWSEHYHEVTHTMSDVWDSFTNFALRDNVLEVAVGLM